MTKSRSWAFVVALVGATCLGAPVVVAQELSDFERETQESVLRDAGLTLDTLPAGKLIEAIDVFVIEPFDARDPVPGFVNALHVKSRDYVIRQELAVRVGSVYDERLIDDSVQSLRTTLKFSLALVTAARGSTPGRVRVVVIAKDIWSLRLNLDPDFADERLTRLLLIPSEVNLFGTHSTLGALYLLELDRVTLGGIFFKPQVADSNIGLYLAGGAIVERATGHNEGNYGYFQYYRPFKSSYERWAWSVGMGWHDAVTRHYQGSSVRIFEAEGASGEVERMPEIYDTDRLTGEYKLTRSFGASDKVNLSLGVEADRQRYQMLEESREFSPEAQADFQDSVLPTSDTRISPFAQLRARSTRFQRLINVETLSLQEDLWLGHDALLRLYPASQSLGSSRSLLGVESALGYSLELGSGLARAKLRMNVELSDLDQTQVEFEMGARLVSPKTPIGRLHLDFLAADRARNYLNRPDYVLGAQSRLRGYPYNAFQGDRLVSVNLEYRSVPVEIFGMHWAGAAFYDSGDAVESEPLQFKHSVGVGCRVLLPQFDRTVFRFDWGARIDHQEGISGNWEASFGQAFSLPMVEEPSVLDAVLVR